MMQKDKTYGGAGGSGIIREWVSTQQQQQ